ncbi:Hypothetical protein mma_0577 [Janthinobacterium sp. Marseille]|nr:DGQHR domain-containing protein [Janthinobacterium sp. Marseille]ABR91635.1 Hypothetical protein mma_0577 [Janthinobacterium sp. Marseille]
MLSNLQKSDALQALARTKNRGIVHRSIKPVDFDAYAQEGWIFSRKNKTTIRVEKPKSEKHMLRDRIWCLLHKLKFEYITNDTLSEKSAEEVFDVIAVGEEVTIGITSLTPEDPLKRDSLRKLIERLSFDRERLGRNTQSALPKDEKKRVAVAILFLSGISIPEQEKNLAKDSNVILFDEKDLDYYEKLAGHLGPAAKYQLFADVLPGKTIPGLQIRVPAVRTKMGNSVCYAFPISPEYLLKIAYVSHRTKGKASDVNTYQRMMNKTRLSNIKEYISNNGVFPTNIVINLDKSRLRFEKIRQENTKAEEDISGTLGWLEIRPAYKSAWIIDGQHRLFSYSGHELAATSHLSVLAFEGLQASKQAQLFVDINAKQKSVKSSLLQELYSELHWDAEDPSTRARAIVSKAIQVLDLDRDSPLHNRIQTADSIKDNIRCISLASIFSAIEKRGFHIAAESKGHVTEYGPLWAGDNETTLLRTVFILKHWFGVVSDSANSWWTLGAAEGGGLAMNDGVTTCLNVLRSVFSHLEDSGLTLIRKNNEALWKELTPYAKVLGEYLGTLNTEDRKRFRDLRGSQGQTARTRRCQQAIRNQFPEFNPSGLDEFLNLEKAQTNLRAKEIIDRIEVTLKDFVLEELKQEFGVNESEWFVEGVPQVVRLEVMGRYEKDNRKRGAPQHYFELIDYRRIALDHWDLFEPILGFERSGNKEKKTKWMVSLNEQRNIVSHPSSAVSLSLEQLAELEGYEAKLTEQLASYAK